MPLVSPPSSTPKLDSVSPELGTAVGAWAQRALCEIRGHLTTCPLLPGTVPRTGLLPVSFLGGAEPAAPYPAEQLRVPG